jgi:hypothetical protein
MPHSHNDSNSRSPRLRFGCRKILLDCGWGRPMPEGNNAHGELAVSSGRR